LRAFSSSDFMAATPMKLTGSAIKGASGSATADGTGSGHMLDKPLTLSRPVSWCVIGVGGLFAGLALLFFLFPERGALLFGVEASDSLARAYVRAVGIRDLALAAYLVLLTLFASARAVRIVLLATIVIPAADLVLVASQPGPLRLQLLLHLSSAGLFAALALWVTRSGGVRS
jgi:hypothetical protein